LVASIRISATSKLGRKNTLRMKIVRSARSLARVGSSSAPSLLYPATSAARMAASFQVSAMAALSPQGRVAQLIVRDRSVDWVTPEALHHQAFRRVYSAMTNRANADFLQILLRQLRQDALVDLVLAKASLILSKLHNCNARPRSQSPISHGRAPLLAITHDSAGRDGRVWAGLALASPPGRSVRPATSSLGPRKTQQRPALSQRGPLR
jgi:hypothetical protein